MKISFSKLNRVAKYSQVLILIIIVFLFAGTLGIKQNQTFNNTAPTPVPKIETKQVYSDFHLVIPALNISAPVIADVDGTDKDTYFKALEGGVAHYQNTSKPGEGSNIFIFGHSSYYAWSPGDYKEVFKTLDGLEKGDEIIIWREGKEYKYKVTETKLVEPTEVSVLKPTKTEQVTLMTCWPPGTIEKRLIVIAKPE